MPLKPLVDALSQDRWPETLDWSGLAADASIKNMRGMPLRFVTPSSPPPSALDFERRIYERGEVETRPAIWHDAFHACAWLTFPQAKARINALHIEDGLDDTPNRRSALRNALTLIDEGGLLIAFTDAEQERMLRGFAWHELFWQQRDAVRQSMDFVIFGHALYERALGMHHGATGRGVLIRVEPSYFQLHLADRLRLLDTRLYAVLDDTAALAAPGFLQPVPIKGIPGWAPENEREDYYFDTSQFRTGRRAGAAC